MKNTKRFITGMVTLAMVSAMAPMNVFATENTIPLNANTSSGSTDVKYSVDPSYTVVIPASVTLSDTSTTNATISVDETAKPFKLAKGQTLSVNIADVETNDFKVKCGTVEVPYTVTAGTSTTALERGSTAAAFTNDDKTAKTLTFSQINSTLATVAGEYIGTLTFGISLEDAAYVPKTFTSLSNGDILRVGDTLEVASGGYDFLDDGCSLLAYNAPFTVVRANVEGAGTPFTTVTEDVDGAYYVIKGNTNNYFDFGGRLAVTDTSDGVIITTKNDDYLGSYWAIDVYEP